MANEGEHKGVVESIKPFMKNNQQETASFGGRTYFKQWTKIDGVEGMSNTQKPDAPYKEGDIVTYDKKLSQSGKSHNFSNIKKFNPDGNRYQDNAGRNFSNAKSSYNDPAIVKAIAMGMCQTAAMKHFLLSTQITGEKYPEEVSHINILADIYCFWVLNGVDENAPNYRDSIARKYYAITLAVECIQFEHLNIKMKEDVIAAAEILMEPFNESEDV